MSANPQSGLGANPLSGQLGPGGLGSLFELQFPQTLATYPKYEEAQRAVDFLADNKFEVANLCIVGSDLKSVERVLGRKTWGTVLRDAALSGVSMALLIAVIMMIFVPTSFPLVLLAALVVGVAVSMIFGAIAYALSGGRRDFTSASMTIATSYEILCENKLVQQAKELLLTMPGERAKQFSG